LRPDNRTRILRGLLVFAALGAAGCRTDMYDQPRYTPLRPSAFFADGRSARPLPEGTVARGRLGEDVAFETGRGPNGQFVAEFPMPVTREMLERGRERYDIFCAVCHDRLGNGLGMIVRRGYRRPPSFHIDRLREAEPGHMYDVIANGFGAMPDYRSEIPAADRWAIVAYLRVLQRSQQAGAGDVPADALGRMAQ
jgi:mono/diheme cytochrome c family protein